jgi:hypothetical protein
MWVSRNDKLYVSSSVSFNMFEFRKPNHCLTSKLHALLEC